MDKNVGLHLKLNPKEHKSEPKIGSNIVQKLCESKRQKSRGRNIC